MQPRVNSLERVDRSNRRILCARDPLSTAFSLSPCRSFSPFSFGKMHGLNVSQIPSSGISQFCTWRARPLFANRGRISRLRVADSARIYLFAFLLSLSKNTAVSLAVAHGNADVYDYAISLYTRRPATCPATSRDLSLFCIRIRVLFDYAYLSTPATYLWLRVYTRVWALT